jgi:preprotein translocase subunit SecA
MSGLAKSPLHLAVERQDLLEVREILNSLDRDKALEIRDEEGETPLHWAAYTAGEEIVSELILFGFNVNLEDFKGNTSLHIAGTSYRAETFQCLLSFGADPLKKNREGKTPLECGFKNYSEDLAEYVGLLPIAQTSEFKILAWLGAASRGHLKILQQFIDGSRGDFDIQAVNPKDKNALHCAFHNHKEILVSTVDFLIKAGVDLDAIMNRSGETPLHRMMRGYVSYAHNAALVNVKDAYEQAVCLLLKAGADPSIQDEMDMAAIQLFELLPLAQRSETISALLKPEDLVMSSFGTAGVVECSSHAFLTAEKRFTQAERVKFLKLKMRSQSLDYESFKAKALVFLIQYFDKHFPECTFSLGAKEFFNLLSEVRYKVLDDAEKLGLARVYFYAAMQISNTAPNQYSDPDKTTVLLSEFIQAFCRLKQISGESVFWKLIKIKPLLEAEASQEALCGSSLLQCYLSLSQLITAWMENLKPSEFPGSVLVERLADQASLWASGDLAKLQQEWTKLYKAELKRRNLLGELNSEELAQLISDFGAPSENVEFPINPRELRSIVKEYQQFQKLSEICLGMGLTQLKQQVQEIQNRLKALWDSDLGLSPQEQLKKMLPLRLSPDHLRLLAVICAIGRISFGKFPYPVQVFAILGMLKNPKGRLLQIKTGEGKTLTTALAVGFLASLEINVHVITSAKDLALRDYEENKGFFNALGLSAFHVCGSRHTVKQYDQTILYGTNTDFEWIRLGDLFCKPGLEQLPSGNFCLALVDEVDNLLMDTVGNATRIAIPGRERFEWVYEPILDFVKPRREMLPWVLRKVLSAYKGGIYAEQVSGFSDEKLKTWMTSARRALYELELDKHYSIGESIRRGEKTSILHIDHGNTELIADGVERSFGVHQFLQAKHAKEGVRIHAESLTSAEISHPSFLNHYYLAIFGMTGTLGEASERNGIFQTYPGVDSFDVPTHKPCLRRNFPPIILATQGEYWSEFLRKIQAFQETRRPLLILCHSIKSSREFSSFLLSHKISHQLLNEQQHEDKDHLVLRAGHPGVITVATGSASRGTNFILTQESVDLGGLEVWKMFLPRNKRVEKQMDGRAARQGQPGSSLLFLCVEADELIGDLNIRPRSPHYLELLMESRSHKVAVDTKRSILFASRAAVFFKIECAFSKLFKQVVNELEGEFSEFFESLEKTCKKIKFVDLSAGFVVSDFSLFSGLEDAALSLLQQQFQGVKVNWKVILDGLKERYIEHLTQQWAEFFTDLYLTSGDFPMLWAKFHDELLAPLKFLLKDPKQAFVELLAMLLGVGSDYFSATESVTETAGNPACLFYKAVNQEVKAGMALTLV